MYLGSVFTQDNDCLHDLWARTGKAKAVTKSMENIWKSNSISNHTKLRILEATAFNTVLYGCETWTNSKEIRDKLLAFEMHCYRRILQVSWTERKTNREICDKLGIERDLLQRAIQRKIQLFGHICRMDDNRKITRKPCCRKETARCRSCSFSV